MCQSQREGGQRCASHARTALDRAQRRHDTSATPSTALKLYAARVDYASTPEGEQQLRSDLAALPDGSDARADAEAVLQRGLAQRERNAAVRAAYQAGQRQKQQHEQAVTAALEHGAETVTVRAGDVRPGDVVAALGGHGVITHAPQRGLRTPARQVEVGEKYPADTAGRLRRWNADTTLQVQRPVNPGALLTVLTA